ncbi:MAG: hypothetical protein IPK60_07870 [Sandaracinaceae bacterium]|nr:hypothetical protein [Sandaracinaceae bacterium]
MGRKQLGLFLALVVAASGCSDSEDVMPGIDGGGDSGTGNIDSGPGTDLGVDLGIATDGGMSIDSGPGTDAGPECPALSARTVVTISAEITESATWTCNNLYVLNDLIFVRSPAVITIEPGTIVQGNDLSALIMTPGSRLVADGTASRPILFTSSKSAGERSHGDWGGLVMLGNAPINLQSEGAPVRGQVEGIDASDMRGQYGGSDATSSCGTLRYARIEFAGYAIAVDNELNGLTLAGCGSDTIIDYVQVHRGDDDGVEIFGGTVDIKHIVITGALDDCLDWDQGWTGRGQFIIAQQHSGSETGIEADNNRSNNDLTPRSAPTLWNVTLVGTNNSAEAQFAADFRRGTAGLLHNVIMMGFPRTSVDVRDASSVAQTASGALDVTNAMFFQVGADGMTYFATEEGDADNDASFDESAFFMSSTRMNTFGTDPMLGAPYNIAAPNFAPAAASAAGSSAATPPSTFFDATATYRGAIAPGGSDWTSGWTAYPEN